MSKKQKGVATPEVVRAAEAAVGAVDAFVVKYDDDPFTHISAWMSKLSAPPLAELQLHTAAAQPGTMAPFPALVTMLPTPEGAWSSPASVARQFIDIASAFFREKFSAGQKCTFIVRGLFRYPVEASMMLQSSFVRESRFTIETPVRRGVHRTKDSIELFDTLDSWVRRTQARPTVRVQLVCEEQDGSDRRQKIRPLRYWGALNTAMSDESLAKLVEHIMNELEADLRATPSRPVRQYELLGFYEGMDVAMKSYLFPPEPGTETKPMAFDSLGDEFSHLDQLAFLKLALERAGGHPADSWKEGAMVPRLRWELMNWLTKPRPLSEKEIAAGRAVAERLNQRAGRDGVSTVLGVKEPTKEETKPIPMLLWCPACGERHIDAGEFAAKPHHTHACQECGMVWRPALVPTCGVAFLPGYKNL